MNDLSPQETKELEAYSDGYMAGVNEVINKLKALYAIPGDLCEFGDAAENLLMSYGVDLYEVRE